MTRRKKNTEFLSFFFKVKGMSSHKHGKYGGLREARNAKRAGRAMRMTPTAVAQASMPLNQLKKAQLKEAMKQAGFVDTQVSGDGTTGAGSASKWAYFIQGGKINQIALVTQGAGLSQRVGAKIRWKSIQVRGMILPPQPGSGNNANKPLQATMLFVYDRKPKDAVPQVGEILANEPSGYIGSNSLLNDSYRDRFVILRRLDFKASQDASNADTNQTIIPVDEYFKLKSLPAEYNGQTATGALGDIRTGAIYLLLVGTGTDLSAGDTAPQNNFQLIRCTIRTRFADVHG